MSERTIFERILDREIPADIVYEDDHVLAFRDIAPQAPVHVLVIPRKKMEQVTDFADADPREVGLFFQGVAETAKALGLTENGYRVVLNSGAHAQQSVDYVHAHILGGRQMSWPPG